MASLIYDDLPISDLLPDRKDIQSLHDMDRDILKVSIAQNQVHPYITSELISKHLKRQYQFSSLVIQQRIDKLCEIGLLVPCELNWDTTSIPRQYHPFQCLASAYDLEMLKNEKIQLTAELGIQDWCLVYSMHLPVSLKFGINNTR